MSAFLDGKVLALLTSYIELRLQYWYTTTYLLVPDSSVSNIIRNLMPNDSWFAQTAL